MLPRDGNQGRFGDNVSYARTLWTRMASLGQKLITVFLALTSVGLTGCLLVLVFNVIGFWNVVWKNLFVHMLFQMARNVPSKVPFLEAVLEFAFCLGGLRFIWYLCMEMCRSA